MVIVLGTGSGDLKLVGVLDRFIELFLFLTNTLHPRSQPSNRTAQNWKLEFETLSLQATLEGDRKIPYFLLFK